MSNMVIKGYKHYKINYVMSDEAMEKSSEETELVFMFSHRIPVTYMVYCSLIKI